MHLPRHSFNPHREAPLRPVRSPYQARLVCLLALAGCVLGAGMCVVAVALHPPVGVMPLVLLLCIGAPVVGTWELPRALAVLQRHHFGGQAKTLAHFRRSLARLPEVEHPLDG